MSRTRFYLPSHSLYSITLQSTVQHLDPFCSVHTYSLGNPIHIRSYAMMAHKCLSTCRTSTSPLQSHFPLSSFHLFHFLKIGFLQNSLHIPDSGPHIFLWTYTISMSTWLPCLPLSSSYMKSHLLILLHSSEVKSPVYLPTF